MFDEFEIAILYIDTKIKTLGTIFDKLYNINKYGRHL